MPPPRASEALLATELLLIVQLIAMQVPLLKMPPPDPALEPPTTELPWITQLLRVRSRALLIPPPALSAVLPMRTQSRSVSRASLLIFTPPPTSAWPLLIVRPEMVLIPARMLKMRKFGIPPAMQ